MNVREPYQLAPAQSPITQRPKTVTDTRIDRQTQYISLDRAIELALQNAEVIRVLQGTTAGSTGQTIYDPAITNTQVDVQRARFDPNLNAAVNLSRNESPSAFIDPANPANAVISAADVTQGSLTTGISNTNTFGGQVNLNASATPTNVAPNAGLGLNPQTPTSLDVSYTQPLLRGRGNAVNLAPVVIARINTERSLYGLKDGVQNLVRSVIDGYWQLVAARVRLWSQEQQVEQLETAFKFFDAQRQVGRGDLGDTAQAEVSLTQFRASLIAAEAEILDREAALFNALGIPPQPNVRLVPTTAPIREKETIDWDQLVATAADNRPDVIQQKLDIEADRQQLQITCNGTLPQLDAVGLVRMNGLGGRAPGGQVANSEFLQFNDLQVGLSLATPLGQRAARAQFRQDQLNLARDEALLRQQLHAVTHDLAASIRNLEQFFAQYEAFQKVRAASRTNLQRQIDFFQIGGIATERPIYLNVLQAVTDWGNAIDSEASALVLYNVELANLAVERGTILEEHGVYFQEELYGSVGPFGVCTDQPFSYRRDPKGQEYPASASVSGNHPRYQDGDEAAEEAFDLESFTSRLTQKRSRDRSRAGADKDTDKQDADEQCDRMGVDDEVDRGRSIYDDGKSLIRPRQERRETTPPRQPESKELDKLFDMPESSLEKLRNRAKDLLKLNPGK